MFICSVGPYSEESEENILGLESSEDFPSSTSDSVPNWTTTRAGHKAISFPRKKVPAHGHM
jgi:hypothetical protein